MPKLNTPQALLDTLNEAAKRKPTAAELREQSVSYIIGSVKSDSGITRAQVEEVLKFGQGQDRKTG
jgi:hypothetical protein